MSENLYVLDHGCSHRLYAGGQRVNYNKQRCPVCNVFPETLEPPEIEIALNHLGRHRFAEHLWHHNIFREDLTELWRNTGLTGFRTKPVHIVGWYEKPEKPLPEGMPTYYELVTTSKVRLIEPPPRGAPCPRCGFIEYDFPKLGIYLANGMRVDPTSWDGSDFFGLAHYEFILCSYRAAAVTLEAGYNKHIAFVRAEDWARWGDFDYRKWTPKAYGQHMESFLIRRVENL